MDSTKRYPIRTQPAQEDANVHSPGAHSASHDSLPAVGTYPLGSLKVHSSEQGTLQEEDELLAQEVDMQEDDEPPPLDGDSDLSRDAGTSVFRHSMGGGDVVIILDLPDIFQVGYDCVSFTAKHFGGMRDIPPGPHFFWVAHPEGISTRCGVWLVSTGDSRVHVLQWDKYNETLGKSTNAEARVQVDNVASIHHQLVSYNDPSSSYGNAGHQAPGVQPNINPEANERIWARLTDCITESVLNRILGQQHGDWFIHTGDRVKGAAVMAAEVELDKRISNSYLQGREINFTFSQLSKTYSMSHVGADRTQDAMDSTSYILSMLYDPALGLTDQDIVGEYQFAYITGTHLGNDSCVQQWWHMLVKLILQAYSLPIRNAPFTEALLRTTAAQISHNLDFLDTSIFDYSESQTRELRLALIVYKRRLEEIPHSTSTALALRQIEAVVVRSPLEWDLDGDSYVRRGKVMTDDGEELDVEVADLQAEDERGEWAPEIVELDESGKQKGLVSWTD